jgi:hypothetical protein
MLCMADDLLFGLCAFELDPFLITGRQADRSHAGVFYVPSHDATKRSVLSRQDVSGGERGAREIHYSGFFSPA